MLFLFNKAKLLHPKNSLQLLRWGALSSQKWAKEKKSQHLLLVSQLPSLLLLLPPSAGPGLWCWCSQEALPWRQAGKRAARLWGRCASGTESGCTGKRRNGRDVDLAPFVSSPLWTGCEEELLVGGMEVEEGAMVDGRPRKSPVL